MKNLFSLFLIIFLSQNCLASNFNKFTDSTEVNTIFYYQKDKFHGGTTLKLASNNTFVQSTWGFDCVNTTTTYSIEGTYSQEHNKIELKPKTVTIIESNADKETKQVLSYEAYGNRIITGYYQVDVENTSYLLPEYFYMLYERFFEKSTYGFLDMKNQYMNWSFYSDGNPKTTFTIDDLPEEWEDVLNPSAEKIYKIQLGAFKNPTNFDKSTVQEFGKITYLPTEKSVILILLGKYKTHEAATEITEKIKAKGLEAMVIAVQNGKKLH